MAGCKMNKINILYDQIFQNEYMPDIKLAIVREPVDYVKVKEEMSADPSTPLPIFFPEKYAIDISNFNPDPYDLELIENFLTPFNDLRGIEYIRYETKSIYLGTIFCKQRDVAKRICAILLNGCFLYIDDMIEKYCENLDSNAFEITKFLMNTMTANRPLDLLEKEPELASVLGSSMVKELNLISKLLIAVLHYHKTVGYLKSHREQLWQMCFNYFWYHINYEQPAYRSALSENRPLTEEEWRNYRWHSVFMNEACFYEWTEDLRTELIGANDTIYTLINQLAILHNDVYSYAREKTTKRKMLDNRVYDLIVNKHMKKMPAMIEIMERSQKLTLHLLDLYEYLPNDARLFLECALQSVGDVFGLLISTKRYAYKLIGHAVKSKPSISVDDNLLNFNSFQFQD